MIQKQRMLTGTFGLCFIVRYKAIQLLTQYFLFLLSRSSEFLSQTSCICGYVYFKIFYNCLFLPLFCMSPK